ncbi:MAG: cytochrome ubiquinol oxidase subunit I [Vulcanimicrobiaceae bacterium]
MDHLLAARAQMGTSLAFHFIFAALGVGLPLLLVIVEGLWLRTRDVRYYRLARTWSRAMLLLFAIGAVSGTTLSFELGLLWPNFMKHAGAIVGIPFSAEGFAFFIEAIFVGIYLYGWDRLSPRAHWLCSIPIAVSGALSAAFVTAVNAWMNTPAGFSVVRGKVVDIDPIGAIFNPAMPTEVIHTTLAAYVFTAFAVAAVYAFAKLRNPLDTYAVPAIRAAMLVAIVAVPLQMIVGDVSARFDAHSEPIKFAAAEAQFQTEHGAPLQIGGIPNENDRTTKYAIRIPYVLSILAFEDPHATIRGLDAFARADQPAVGPVHLSFDTMVGTGSLLLAIAGWWAIATRFGKRAPTIWLGRALVASGGLGFIAMEAGWMVTELGRQPWIATGFLRTKDAVTTAPALDLAFYGFTGLYLFLAVTLVVLLLRIRTGEGDPEPRTLPAGNARTA